MREYWDLTHLRWTRHKRKLSSLQAFTSLFALPFVPNAGDFYRTSIVIDCCEFIAPCFALLFNEDANDLRRHPGR